MIVSISDEQRPVDIDEYAPGIVQSLRRTARPISTGDLHDQLFRAISARLIDCDTYQDACSCIGR